MHISRLMPFTAIAMLTVAYPAFAQTGTAANTGTTIGASPTATNNTGTNNTGAGNTMGTTGNANLTTGASGSTMPGPNWNTESSYWRNTYSARPYYTQGRDYSTYEPAYRYGMDLYNRNPGRSYSQLSQDELNRGWTQARGSSNLTWDEAEAATRDAYTRLYDNRNDRTGTASPDGTGAGTTGTTVP